MADFESTSDYEQSCSSKEKSFGGPASMKELHLEPIAQPASILRESGNSTKSTLALWFTSGPAFTLSVGTRTVVKSVRNITTAPSLGNTNTKQGEKRTFALSAIVGVSFKMTKCQSDSLPSSMPVEKMLGPGTKAKYNNQDFRDGLFYLKCNYNTALKWLQQVSPAW